MARLTLRSKGWWIAASLLLTAPSVHAQSGLTVSSCRQCHELGGQETFRAGDPWHKDHAFADLCSNCHAGDPTAVDESRAHVGIVDPTKNGGERCGGCHQDTAAALSAYLGRRGSAPERAAKPEPGRPVGKSPSAKLETRKSSPVNTGLSVSAAAIALLGGAFVTWDRRRQGGTPSPFRIRDAEWSPYFAGALLGLLVAVSMALFEHRLSGGGAYQYIGGRLGRILAPHSAFFRYVLPDRADWDLVTVGGAVLGAFIAARSSRTFRIRTMPDSGWQAVFGSSVGVRWILSFVGAALTGIASGIAGGCTASLAVSGGAALAPGAFAFMAGMFAGGIPTAWFVYRRTS